jgi:hypothetical protein
MKRLLTSILLVLVATTASAQAPIEVKTNDGRIVILKPDGTWEYKKDNPQPSPTPSVNPAKGNNGADSLPPNFTGHDAETLFTQLSGLKKRLVKNEFETTSDYEKRVAQEKQKPILGNLTIRDTFSLVIPNVRASYDADSQKMLFFLPVEKNPLAELYRDSGMGQDRKTAYNLEYIDRYNIQWRDDSGYGRQGIFFDELGNLGLTGESYSQGFSAEVNLGVEDAKRLKTMSKAVAIVQFEEPYVGSGRVDRQLQVRLMDIYFFDHQTGRILAKVSQSGK